MNEPLASALVAAAGIYVATGLLFAVPFVIWGLSRIDPAASKPSLGLRLLLLPGSAAFWPLLLRRWLRREPPPTERNAHRQAAGAGS